MNYTTPQQLLDQLDGATIVGSAVTDEEGFHLHLQDGRVLIIYGSFALSVMRLDTEKLH